MLICCKCIYCIELEQHRYGTDRAQIRGSCVEIVGKIGKAGIVGGMDCDSQIWRGLKWFWDVYVT